MKSHMKHYYYFMLSLSLWKAEWRFGHAHALSGRE